MPTYAQLPVSTLTALPRDLLGRPVLHARQVLVPIVTAHPLPITLSAPPSHPPFLPIARGGFLQPDVWRGRARALLQLTPLLPLLDHAKRL
jgi:hypothetical protein